MRKIHVAAWSGGKDSTYMIDELLVTKEPLDEIIFCDTGFEFKLMYEYIELVEKYWFDKYKITVTKLNWKNKGLIWHNWSDNNFTKGQYKGKPRGFPFHMGMSWCTRELKLNPMKKYIEEKYPNDEIFEYVGIALNEPDRITNDKNKLYWLFDNLYHEDEITQLLVEKGLHNPLYNHFHRTGCYTCPKQSLSSLYKMWKHYPEEWQTIVKMQVNYKRIGAGIWKFKNYTIEELIKKFLKYEAKGKPTNYLDEEQPIGCMCK